MKSSNISKKVHGHEKQFVNLKFNHVLKKVCELKKVHKKLFCKFSYRNSIFLKFITFEKSWNLEKQFMKFKKFMNLKKNQDLKIFIIWKVSKFNEIPFFSRKIIIGKKHEI